MNPVGWVTFLGVVITAVVSLLSAHFSARAARRASDRTAELETVRLQLETRDVQIASWRADVEALRRERIEDDARCREQVAELSTHITRLRGKLRDLGAPFPDPPSGIGDTGAGQGGDL